MRKRISNLNPAVLLVKAKYLLLILSAIVVAANLYFLNSTRTHAESYTEQQNQATWFLFQLTKEFSELKTITPFSADSETYRARTLLKYELTWSRFDLLLTSQEADTFIALPGARNYFQSLFNQFKSLEPQLEQIHTKQGAERLGQEFSVLFQSMIEYVNTNFRVKSPLYQTQMDAAKSLHNTQLISLMLLVVCIVLAMFILHKEAVYHKILSRTDSLTGIGNRLAMFYDLNKKLSQKQPFTLYLLDLNGFKQINDRYGHLAGDQVLRTITGRLNELRLECYRIGGDEFAVISGQTEADAINQTIDLIHDSGFKPVMLKDDTYLDITTSIGIACYPQDSNQVAELLKKADLSMYSDKRSQKIHAVNSR
ncbi:GGDEF domain-containing protein [Vibrio aquaticus]|uniref:GGDEF domain-containing protein n=1 Tax=Vibrio aquaticus TaxID=2496559 RepID=A0A432D2T7_9VIBR|nr:GGDEF domain-containing protein [Vibrio aquaticus]RTZ18195.1 GGDEF domain-containing protein [Vibrio aquaticus]